MKKTSILLGIGALSIVLFSFVKKDNCEKPEKNEQTAHHTRGMDRHYGENLMDNQHPELMNLKEITFLEPEEEIDLGFDTKYYLPLGFNAYEGMELKLEDIVYIEQEEDVDLGFDTADYLPINFDAHTTSEINLERTMGYIDLDDILFLVEEEEIDLGFDAQAYLPDNFDPYSK